MHIRLSTAYLAKMMIWEYKQSMMPKFGLWKHVHGNFLSHKSIKISSVCSTMANLLWTVSCVHCEWPMHALKLSMEILPSPLITYVAWFYYTWYVKLNKFSLNDMHCMCHLHSLKLQAQDHVTQVYHEISLDPKLPSFLSALQVMEN